jgi:serine/threonine protein kinase
LRTVITFFLTFVILVVTNIGGEQIAAQAMCAGTPALKVRFLCLSMSVCNHTSSYKCTPTHTHTHTNTHTHINRLCRRAHATITHARTHTHAQAKRGTPSYMAPELFSENSTHSSASDLWALGCVLYESAMGRPPFLNSSFNQLVQEILHNEPAPIPGMCVEGVSVYECVV